MAFLLQLLPPLLLCFPVLFLTRLLRGNATGDGADWRGRLATAFFLAAQLGLIYASRLAPPIGLAVVVGLLGVMAAFCLKGPPRTLATLCFAGYLAYWFVQKYVIPLGLTGTAIFDVRWLNALYLGVKSVAIVGISFMGFKVIHFYVDWRAGEIERAEPGEVLAWLFFFPAVIAGPIQRFQDWQAQRMSAPAWVGWQQITEGLQRILIGLFLKFVLGDTIYGLSIEAMNVEVLATASTWQLALGAGCYSLYLYWDFAGYSHIAIGSALFWGIRLPENFRHPFAARNLAEFWNRWHITFSQLLRDYLFYPLSLRIRRQSWSRRFPLLALCIPPVVTFLLAGIWHGAAIGFVIYGLIHGVGLAVVSLLKRKKPTSRFACWWAQSRIGYAGGMLITFTYVSFSFIFFCLPFQGLAVLFRRLAGL